VNRDSRIDALGPRLLGTLVLTALVLGMAPGQHDSAWAAHPDIRITQLDAATTEATLAKSFLALLVPAGFAMLATGLCRSKNAAHTAFMAFFGSVIAVAAFWICGYALADGGVFGPAHFLLRNRPYEPGLYAQFAAWLPLVIVATCIPIGALAERWRLKSFYVYALFMAMLVFPVFAHWTWGGGWLSRLGEDHGLGSGFVDRAGSGAVHALGGLCALAGALVLGPRLGRYSKSGTPNPVPAHNVPMALLGSFLLAVGWFGFNTIRSLDFSSNGGPARIDLIATVTALAGAGGAIAAATYMIMTIGKPDPTIVANGLLAGLVASSASAGLIGPVAGFIVGVVSGILVCLAVKWFDNLHIDDPVGVIAVHGLGGLWGVLAVGLLAHGSDGGGSAVNGLVYGGGRQLVAQLIGCLTLIVWTFGLSWVFFTMLDKKVPLRVEPEAEITGLDVSEVGVLGYAGTEGMGERGG
jgi:ammonium transporter, Amt family